MSPPRMPANDSPKKSFYTEMGRAMQRVYRLGPVMFVPHAVEDQRFVGPGFGTSNFTTYTAEELIAVGARPSAYPLWERHNMEEVIQ